MWSFAVVLKKAKNQRRHIFTNTEIIDQIKAVIEKRGHKVIGCSDEEIQALTTAQCVDYLPELYRQLLKETGKTIDWFFLGHSAACYELHSYRNEFLQEELSIPGLLVPSDIFVFMSCQGVDWWFFRTKTDDTAIYGWSEFEPGFWKAAPNLAEYLTKALNKTFRPKPAEQYFIYDPAQDQFLPLGTAYY
ncbi:MAG: hypothetical protein BroJett018_35300 [Chloroflexota bacterium]|nr:MAG: hypothetical protein BroJett018_35300 [Chloroflexota bacterium]